jgi:hypothetical protein
MGNKPVASQTTKAKLHSTSKAQSAGKKQVRKVSNTVGHSARATAPARELAEADQHEQLVSDCLFRLRKWGSIRAERLAQATARIVLHRRAAEVLGDEHKAELWLRRKNPALSGKSPLFVFRKKTDRTKVFDLLGRIEHGVFS